MAINTDDLLLNIAHLTTNLRQMEFQRDELVKMVQARDTKVDQLEKQIAAQRPAPPVEKVPDAIFVEPPTAP